jgi:hypothetical protein
VNDADDVGLTVKDRVDLVLLNADWPFLWPQDGAECEHARGPLTGIEHGWMYGYRRPLRRLFRKTLWKQCCFCGVAADATL